MQALRRASWRSSLRRDPSSRIRNPPSTQPRLFTQNCKLLLSRIPPRTQLPYLHSSVRQSGQQYQVRFFRLFTLREPKTLRDACVTFVQVGVVFFAVYGCWKVAEFGIQQETLERRHPTPGEYSWTTRVNLRVAIGEEDACINGSATPNWKATSLRFLKAIERLEDRKGDGKAVKSQLGENEDIFVAGVGRMGLDISACSEPWRRGYYQALMGAGRCAERLDGWVLDRVRGILTPEKNVIGPSYPGNKPAPAGVGVAPREEDCEPASEPPERYYLKVITTRGFSVGQRLLAALAYADWLRYKNLNEAARGMHTWAVDIALEGVEGTSTDLVDNRSGILKQGATTLTPNLLLAVNSFGSHFATTGDMAAALSVFLSILRTQQNLPPAALQVPDTQGLPANTLWNTFLKYIIPPKYPEAPPSGNDLLTRTPESICSSTTTMAHIGEVLFATDLAALSIDPSKLSPSKISPLHPSRSSSPSLELFVQPTDGPIGPTATQSAGLAWTRQAVEVAEAALQAGDPDNGPEKYIHRSRTWSTITDAQRAEQQRSFEQQKHCATCLMLALNNWVKMVERFERAEQREAAARARSRALRHAPAPGEQDQSQETTRLMTTAAYQKNATPDQILAEAKAAAAQRASARAEQERQVKNEFKKEQAATVKPAPAQAREGGGWGMFWSGKLGLSPALKSVEEQIKEGKGTWEEEAIKVRARRWEARLMGRQLGLE